MPANDGWDLTLRLKGYLDNVGIIFYPVPVFILVYNYKKYLDPNFFRAPLTYSAGGLKMTC